MSFKDFKNDLLVAIAIVSNAQPTFEEEAIEIAGIRKLEYRSGWLRQAVKSLDEQGLIKVSYHFGGGEDLGMPVTITGDGLGPVLI